MAARNNPTKTGVSDERISDAQEGLKKLHQAIGCVHLYAFQRHDDGHKEIKRPGEEESRTIRTWSIPIAHYASVLQDAYAADPHGNPREMQEKLDNIEAFSHGMAEFVDKQYYNARRPDPDASRHVRPAAYASPPGQEMHAAEAPHEDVYKALVDFLHTPLLTDNDKPTDFLHMLLGDLDILEQQKRMHIAQSPELAAELPTHEEFARARDGITALCSAAQALEDKTPDDMRTADFLSGAQGEILKKWNIPLTRYAEVVDKFFSTGERIYENGACEELKQARLRKLDYFTERFNKAFSPVLESSEQRMGRA